MEHQLNIPVTIIPDLRNVLVTERLISICEALNYEIRKGCNKTSISYIVEEASQQGTIVDENGYKHEITEDDFYLELQNVIRKSNGSLEWIAISSIALVVFITSEKITSECMNSWLLDRIKEIEPNTAYRYCCILDSPYIPDALKDIISLERFI
ncbi:MAG: hypothetical protein PHI31_06440 [Desulfuromonadaceae bacterium]|nr:hypothetical protein [Desulfuromonadaceae bacterium]